MVIILGRSLNIPSLFTATCNLLVSLWIVVLWICMCLIDVVRYDDFFQFQAICSPNCHLLMLAIMYMLFVAIDHFWFGLCVLVWYMSSSALWDPSIDGWYHLPLGLQQNCNTIQTYTIQHNCYLLGGWLFAVLPDALTFLNGSCNAYVTCLGGVWVPGKFYAFFNL